MKNELILNLENKIHGFHTRLKELHFAAPSVSIHKIIDDFDGELLEFDDEIMEEAQSLFDFILPGEIKPVLPESLEIEDLLQEIRGTLAGFLEAIEDSRMMTGIKSETESFWHTLNKTIYLIRIAKKGE
jgi:hypothetical protein